MGTTLHEIIEDIWMEAQDIDSIFRNKRRYMMVRYAKEGLRELEIKFCYAYNGDECACSCEL